MAVTGTHVPAAGGAEQSFHEMLSWFTDHGWEVLLVTTMPRRRPPSMNYRVVYAPLESPISDIDRHVAEFKPDIMFCQMIWSEEVLQRKWSYGVPVVYFARNTRSNLDLGPGADWSPDMVVANSHDTKKVLDAQWGCDCFVLHPVVLDDRYEPSNELPREYHLLVNPLVIKGGQQLREMARLRPNLRFAVIYGWEQFRLSDDADADWDPRIVRKLEAALRKTITSMPDYAQFDDLANVDVLPVSDYMADIYRRIRVLLLPSRWREALGRTVVEAAACGVPAIAANVGGVREGPVLPAYLLDADASVSDWTGKADQLGLDDEWAMASSCVREAYLSYRERLLTELWEIGTRIARMCQR